MQSIPGGGKNSSQRKRHQQIGFKNKIQHKKRKLFSNHQNGSSGGIHTPQKWLVSSPKSNGEKASLGLVNGWIKVSENTNVPSCIVKWKKDKINN